ncbi:MAG: pentapeptide repeat-containing protein [Myxococcales bacterium]|nr:pentapeptide repeat-containing protein [Myxococcales bacterium]
MNTKKLLDLYKNRGWRSFQRANLRGADFWGCQMAGVNLAHSDGHSACFAGCDLSGSNFAHASLVYSDFRGANLSYSDLTGADLRGSDLSQANVGGSKFSGCDLRYARLPPEFQPEPPSVLGSAVRDRVRSRQTGSAQRTRRIPWPLSLVLLAAPTTQDRALAEELSAHLAEQKWGGPVRIWHPGLLQPGRQAGQELRIHVSRADLILPLLSADFLASADFFPLLALALRLQAQGYARVLPIRARPCGIEFLPLPLRALHVLPARGRAISQLRCRAAGWTEVVQEIRRARSVD